MELTVSSKRYIVAGLALMLATAVSAHGVEAKRESFSQREDIVVQRSDGSPIELLISRPTAKTRVPIVLFIDGSGCVSAKRKDFEEVTFLPEGSENRAAKLVIEKPGVEPGASYGAACSEVFLRYYSIDQRVLDHLRAIEYLRKHANWWNGQICLLGWSDGAVIGVPVAAYTPEVQRAVFGGLGGGIPMTKQFEDYIACAPDHTDDRDLCLAKLRTQFTEMRIDPSPLKTWSGADNSYKVWASRLDTVEYHLIKDIKIPVLIVHGALDRTNTPVEAARELARLLRQDRSTNFEYWEIPQMWHGIGNLEDPGRRLKVRTAMINWLFGRRPGPGGPPSFGLTQKQ